MKRLHCDGRAFREAELESGLLSNELSVDRPLERHGVAIGILRVDGQGDRSAVPDRYCSVCNRGIVVAEDDNDRSAVLASEDADYKIARSEGYNRKKNDEADPRERSFDPFLHQCTKVVLLSM